MVISDDKQDARQRDEYSAKLRLEAKLFQLLAGPLHGGSEEFTFCHPSLLLFVIFDGKRFSKIISFSFLSIMLDSYLWLDTNLVV